MSLFAALNVYDGTVIPSIHWHHRAEEPKKFLQKIDKTTSTHVDVHVACDNYATHKHSSVKTQLAKHSGPICTSLRHTHRR